MNREIQVVVDKYLQNYNTPLTKQLIEDYHLQSDICLFMAYKGELSEMGLNTVHVNSSDQAFVGYLILDPDYVPMESYECFEDALNSHEITTQVSDIDTLHEDLQKCREEDSDELWCTFINNYVNDLTLSDDNYGCIELDFPEGDEYYIKENYSDYYMGFKFLLDLDRGEAGLRDLDKLDTLCKFTSKIVNRDLLNNFINHKSVFRDVNTGKLCKSKNWKNLLRCHKGELEVLPDVPKIEMDTLVKGKFEDIYKYFYYKDFKSVNPTELMFDLNDKGLLEIVGLEWEEEDLKKKQFTMDEIFPFEPIFLYLTLRIEGVDQVINYTNNK